MKKILPFLFVALHALSWAAPASAAVCVQASLASYIALGSEGCTIGDFRFSDFALLQRPNGAGGFRSIVVVPVVASASVIGIDLVVNAPVPSLTASPDGPAPAAVINEGRLDDPIAYRVTGSAPTLNGASLFLNGYEASGLASVTGIENLCLDGVFLGVDGVSGCSTGPAATRTLVVVDATPDTTSFLPRTSLAVVTDIGLDGGPDDTDSAALTSASNRFTFAAAPSVVPEPGPVTLLSAGLLAFLPMRRRLRRPHAA